MARESDHYEEQGEGALLAFYDFAAVHWKHLRTAIEKTFAIVSHRTIHVGRLANKTASAMIFKLIQVTERIRERGPDGYKVAARCKVHQRKPSLSDRKLKPRAA
jgi:hypothetical protein